MRKSFDGFMGEYRFMRRMRSVSTKLYLLLLSFVFLQIRIFFDFTFVFDLDRDSGKLICFSDMLLYPASK